MANYDIRPANWDDLSGIVTVEQSSFAEQWDRDEIAQIIGAKRAPKTFVIHPYKSPNQVLGFTVVETKKEEYSIASIAVLPELRRMGLGRRLVGQVVGLARRRRKKCVKVLIRENNLDAQCFFRSLGFYWVETLKGFYDATREDAYIMERKL